MEQQFRKRVTIELDQTVYNELEEFCVETSTEKSELMTDLMRNFLRESMNTMEAMRKGYAEMGHINLEICSEFDCCESEVHSDI